MGPLNLIVPTENVAGLGDVRGLSPSDGLALYYRHAGELSALFDQFAGKVKAKQAVPESDVLQAGVAMVSGAPLIMAEIIAVRFAKDAPWASLDIADGRNVPLMAIQNSDGAYARSEARDLADLVADRGGT